MIIFVKRKLAKKQTNKKKLNNAYNFNFLVAILGKLANIVNIIYLFSFVGSCCSQLFHIDI